MDEGFWTCRECGHVNPGTTEIGNKVVESFRCQKCGEPRERCEAKTDEEKETTPA